jgi:hypothetical protein
MRAGRTADGQRLDTGRGRTGKERDGVSMIYFDGLARALIRNRIAGALEMAALVFELDEEWRIRQTNENVVNAYSLKPADIRGMPVFDVLTPFGEADPTGTSIWQDVDEGIARTAVLEGYQQDGTRSGSRPSSSRSGRGAARSPSWRTTFPPP